MIPQPCVLRDSTDVPRLSTRGFYSAPKGRRRLSITSLLSRSSWIKKRRLSFKIKGQQGVDFLSLICDEAASLKVTGYCSNASDGSICGEAQGDESQLNNFVTYLRKGPLAADLVGAQIDEIPPNYDERNFCSAPDDCKSFVYRTPASSLFSGSETSRSTLSRASSASMMKFNWKPESASSCG